MFEHVLYLSLLVIQYVFECVYTSYTYIHIYLHLFIYIEILFTFVWFVHYLHIYAYNLCIPYMEPGDSVLAGTPIGDFVERCKVSWTNMLSISRKDGRSELSEATNPKRRWTLTLLRFGRVELRGGGEKIKVKRNDPTKCFFVGNYIELPKSIQKSRTSKLAYMVNVKTSHEIQHSFLASFIHHLLRSLKNDWMIWLDIIGYSLFDDAGWSPPSLKKVQLRGSNLRILRRAEHRKKVGNPNISPSTPMTWAGRQWTLGAAENMPWTSVKWRRIAPYHPPHRWRRCHHRNAAERDDARLWEFFGGFSREPWGPWGLYTLA